MEERTRFVFCDNTHRDGGSPDSFTFNFADRQITCGDDEVITMELYDFFCQNNAGHGINENNNKFLWNDTLIEIPVGSYTGTTLATTLQTEINSQLAARTKYVKASAPYTRHITNVGSITTDSAFGAGPLRDGVFGGSNIDYAANKVSVTFDNNRFKIDIDLSTASLSDPTHQTGVVYTGGVIAYGAFLSTSSEGYLFKAFNPNAVSVGFDLNELNGKSAKHLGLHPFESTPLNLTNKEFVENSFIICKDAAGVATIIANDEGDPSHIGTIRTLPQTINISSALNAIDLHTDIPNDNLTTTLESNDKLQPTSRFARIPVLVPPAAFVYYHCNGSNEQRLLMPNKYVNSITFTTTNNYEEPVVIAGHVQFTLIFNTVKKAIIQHNEHAMFAEMINYLKDISMINKMEFISQKKLE